MQAIPDYGMATIRDADIMIWAASTLNHMKQQGLNDLPRTLTTTPYDLLRNQARDRGRDYQGLQAALLQLQTTSITTSIRDEASAESRLKLARQLDVRYGRRHRATARHDADLSDWVYDGIVNEKSLLTMHPDYFLLSGGGSGRCIASRVSMLAQLGGWLCRVEVLRDKTGSDARPEEFNRMLRRVIEADQLPDYMMEPAETVDKSPAVMFRRRGEVSDGARSAHAGRG